MRTFFRKKHKAIDICAVSLLFLSLCLSIISSNMTGNEAESVIAETETAQVQRIQTIVIDAGHGGEDGGAVSGSGVVESEINLAIALKLDAMLALLGVDTVMTRTEDISIYSEGSETLRQKKSSDLKNRVELINGQEAGFLVSIHQNKFTSGKYSGAQVFYSARDALGAEISVYAQENLRLVLNPENKRQSAVISDSIYLMKNINCSGILVECGFLSNTAELELLQDPDYQMDIAKALAATLLYRLDIDTGF